MNLIEEIRGLFEEFNGKTKRERWMMNLHKNDLKSVYFRTFVADKDTGEPLGMSTIGKKELNPDNWVGIYRRA